MSEQRIVGDMKTAMEASGLFLMGDLITLAVDAPIGETSLTVDAGIHNFFEFLRFQDVRLEVPGENLPQQGGLGASQSPFLLNLQRNGTI